MELRIKTVSEVLQQLSTVVVVVAKVVDRLAVLSTLEKVRLSDPSLKASSKTAKILVLNLKMHEFQLFPKGFRG